MPFSSTPASTPQPTPPSTPPTAPPSSPPPAGSAPLRPIGSPRGLRRGARIARSPRATTLRLLSLVVAVITAVVVWRDLGTLRHRARALGPLVGVVVADHDLALGTVLRAGDLRVVERHRSQAGPAVLTDPDDVVGRTVVVPVLEGLPVTARALAPARRVGTAALVPVGRRAVRVRADDGLLPRVGDTVDLLAVLDPAFAGATTADPEESLSNSGEADAPGDDRGRSPYEAVIVARGARVLAVDVPDDDTNAATRTVGTTILVTEQEARRVAFAQASGVITLVLDPPEDACCVDD